MPTDKLQPQTEDFARLETEGRNPRTADLDTLNGLELVRTLHAENHTVAAAVDAVLPALADFVDRLAIKLEFGGRLFYVGAGTSGRLGVLDASECPPTFGVEPEMIQGIIAGGEGALVRSVEGAEDSKAVGAKAIRERRLEPNDVVVGIAASGRTPFVIGALEEAKGQGILTAAVINVSDSPLSQIADYTFAAVTGAEAVTGSTRLKAGTAQKMILNLITTAAMVQLGKVYGNLMVDVRATNEKLQDRAVRIVMAGAETENRTLALSALNAADGEVKTAIVALKTGLDTVSARKRLAETNGWVREALEEPRPKPQSPP